MGKIGIILAFLLSVAAAGGSYYLYQGWVEARTIRGVVEAKYDQVKEKMITVQSEKEKIVAEKEKIAVKSESNRAQAEAMQAQVGKLQTEQKLADSEKAALAKKLDDNQKMIAELQTKMGELEQKARDAQAACGVTPADMRTDPFASTSTTSATGAGASQLVFKPVTSGGTAVSKQLLSNETAGVVPAAQEGSSVASMPTPGISTVTATAPSQSSEASTAAGVATFSKVLTVNRKFNFVVVNQGLQDGLKMGDRLAVFKQGQEVATVQVEKLYDKFSAATLVAENPKQQVVEGDEIRKT
jgi:hypothetical protein